MVTFVTTNEGKVREAREYLGAPVEQRAFDYPEIQAEDLGTVAAHGARAAYRELGVPVIVEDSGLSIAAFEGFPGPYSSYVEDTVGVERVWRLTEPEDDRSATFRAVVAYCDGDAFAATPEPVDRETRPSGESPNPRTASGWPTGERPPKDRTASEESRESGDRRGQDLAADERGGATTDAQVDETADAVPVKLFEGTVPGEIVAPRGDGGFGYDPIFEYDGTTFAEMATERKNAVSHRGRALARFAEWYAAADRDG